MKTKFIRQKQRKSLPLFHTSWEGIFEVFGAIFYDIQWEFCILSISYQFSMGISYFSYFLVNYLCYSMGNLYFFTYYSMGGLHFANFPCYSMDWEASGGRGTDVQMDGQTYEIHPCVLHVQDIGPLGPLPKKAWRIYTRTNGTPYGPTDRYMDRPSYRDAITHLKNLLECKPARDGAFCVHQRLLAIVCVFVCVCVCACV